MRQTAGGHRRRLRRDGRSHAPRRSLRERLELRDRSLPGRCLRGCLPAWARRLSDRRVVRRLRWGGLAGAHRLQDPRPRPPVWASRAGSRAARPARAPTRSGGATARSTAGARSTARPRSGASAASVGAVSRSSATAAGRSGPARRLSCAWRACARAAAVRLIPARMVSSAPAARVAAAFRPAPSSVSTAPSTTSASRVVATVAAPGAATPPRRALSTSLA